MPLRLVLRLRTAVFACEAIAVHRAAARNHHVAVFNLGHARHAAGHLLKALAVRGAQLRKKVNVAAE